jgi:hypothetical protein
MRFHRVLDASAGLPEPANPPQAEDPPGPPTGVQAPTPPGEPGGDVPKPPAPAAPDSPAVPPGSVDEHELTRAGAMLHIDSVLGDGLAVDVSPEEGGARVVIWLVRRTAGTTVSDEDAARLLAPFHIGPVR